MQATSGELSRLHEWRGFSGLFVSLGAVFWLAVSVIVVGSLSENAFHWVDHTREVLTIAQTLLADAEDIQSTVNVYAKTGDAKLLQDYSEQRPQLSSLADQLKQQTIDNPRQQITIREKLLPSLTTVESQAAALVKDRAGQDVIAEKHAMDAFRNAIAEIESEEGRLLKQRTEELRRWSQVVWAVRFILVVTALYALVTGVTGLRRMIGSEREQIVALEEANRRLKQETEERSKAEQEALAVSEARTQFVATVSHEIRTPLAGVIGMAELLLDQPELTEESRDLAARLHRASTQMLGVLNEILDYSKLEAGQTQLDSHEFDVQQVLDDVVGLSRFKAVEKCIALNSLIADGVPARIKTDEAKVRQVLLNFVHNAIKFTSEGSVEVSIELDGADMIKFRVRDTGIGLSQTSQQRLFMPYMQAKGTAVKFGGTGLGLSISKRYVEMLGGKIAFRSEPGKGTDIWFSIPQELDLPPKATT